MHVSKTFSLVSKVRQGRTVCSKHVLNCCNMPEMMPSTCHALLPGMNFVFMTTPLRQNECFRMVDMIMTSVESELSVVRNQDNLDCHL